MCLHGRSQAPYYLHYGTGEGLLSVEVYNLLQDSAGFIWMASDHGVTKFDGVNFKHFSIRDGLPHNLVTELFLDLRGRVWCHFYTSGLVYIENDSVHTPGWMKRMAPYQRYLDSFGQLADGRYALGFHPINDSGVVYAVVSEDGSDVEWLKMPGENRVIVFPDKRSPVYATSHGGGDKPYDFSWGPGSKKVHRAILPSSVKGQVHDVIAMEGDSVVAISGANELVVLSPHQRQHLTLPHKVSNSLFFDKHKNLWVGLFKGGVLVFPGASLEAAPKKYLDDYTVTSILEDNNGGYWFSTIEAGVFYMPYIGLQVYTANNGLPENRILKAWLSDTTLWMTYRNGYVTRTNMKKPGPYTFETVVHREYVGPSFIDSNNILNVGVSEFSSHPVPVKEWFYCAALFCDSQGAVYHARTDGGFKRTSASGKEWDSSWKYPSMPRINHIAESRHGRIWLGSAKGPYQLAGETATFLPARYPVLSGSVTCLYTWRDHVFIGIGGKGLFALRGDSLIHLHSGNGLSSDFIHRVVVDDCDTVWLATTSGIDLFGLNELGRQSLAVEHLGAGYGLPSISVNDLVITSADIWAFTDEGLAVIPRQVIRHSVPANPVYLTSLKVNGIQRSLRNALELSHVENNIQVDFQAINFPGAKNTFYAYRLNGPGNIWNYTNVPSLNLSGLKPGDYTLEIRNGTGLKETKAGMLSLEFSILPPFWQRWYVVLVTALLFFSALWVAIHWRIRNLKRSAHLEQQVSVLSFKALQAQMNPHFVYNCLNGIQNFILKNDQHASVDYLNRFSRLVRSVFDHSARDLVPLNEELANIELYISLEQARYPGRIEFYREVDESVLSLKVPPMLLQPFIENAILHGILPAGRDGEIMLSIKAEKDCLAIRITDDGIGIKQNHLIRRKKDRFLNVVNAQIKRAHTGMQVTCERIESFVQRYGLETQIDIADRSTTSLNETGTIVFFKLPILRNT